MAARGHKRHLAKDRAFGVGLLAAATCHALLFAVTALLPARPPARRDPPENVQVELVPARPEPVREVLPAPATDKPSAADAPPAEERIPPKRTPVRTRLRPPIGDVRRPMAVSGAMGGRTPGPTPPPAPVGPAIARSAALTALARPRYRSNPTPDYPIAARRNREEGVVLLTVGVSAEGRPSDISLKQSSGHPSLDAAAMDAVRGWTFQPAMAGATPVWSHVVVPVRFSLTVR